MSKGGVLVDVQATQSAHHRDRGVARYVADLAGALVQAHAPLVHSLLLNPDLAPPGRVEPLVASGRLVYSDRCDLAGAGALHVMSPFELDVPLPRLWLARGGARALPLIVTLYDLIPELFAERYLADAGLRRRYRARCELLRAATAVLSISDATASDAVDLLDLPPERIVVVGAAASSHFRRPGSRDAARAAARAAVPGLAERFVCVTSGLDERKNFERLFRAWSQLRPAVRDEWQLVMVCAMDDLGRNHLEHLARSAGIDHRLLLPGFVADDALRLLYQGADLFVFPSLYEGFGLPIAEALACGASVIGSNVSAMPELLRPEACFDPYDERAIADAIERGLTDASLRAVLDAQAAEPRPDWAAVADRTAEVYEDVLAGPAHGARRKPLIAVVTPLPPAPSGVADYTFALLESLRARCDIHVYPDGERVRLPGSDPPRAPDGIAMFPLAELVERDRTRGGYDCVVYCLGNSEYHAGALAQMRKLRGMVVAHDVRMTELYALAIDEPGATPLSFADALRAMYGDRVPAEATGVGRLSGDAAERLGLLMAREVVELADRFVVMSEFAGRLVRLDARPEHRDRVAVAPFGMRAPRPDVMPTAARRPLVAAFGIVNEVKQAELLVEALPLLLESHPDATLALVGRCSEAYRAYLLGLAGDLGVGGQVVVTGEVSGAEYDAWLDRAAVGAQLRRTSNGECSAAVSDCVAAGVALLVTDAGASRELPLEVSDRIDATAGVSDIAAALAALLDDPARRETMIAAARGYAEARSFRVAADRLYDDVIAPSLARPPNGPGLRPADRVPHVAR